MARDQRDHEPLHRPALQRKHPPETSCIQDKEMTQKVSRSAGMRGRTGRVRKAWRVKIMGKGCVLGELIYAPTAGKARYQKFLSADCDGITFASISVTRAASDDTVLPVVDEAVAALDREQKSTLTHTLKNGRFYTSTDDKTMSCLTQAGLVRNTGRGWDEGEAYFVLTDTGRTAALSLMPLYPEYPEYRA